MVLENNPGGDVMQLTLPATSVFGKEDGDKRPLQAFARHLALSNPPINPEQIVTRMKFDTKAESPKLFFSPVRWLTNDEYAVVKTQAESTDASRAVVMTVAQTDGVKNVPALPGKAPVVEADTDDGVDEPEKRKPAVKTSAVPQKKASNLAATVDEWDDE